MTCNACCDIDMGVFYEPPRNGPTLWEWEMPNKYKG